MATRKTPAADETQRHRRAPARYAMRGGSRRARMRATAASRRRVAPDGGARAGGPRARYWGEASAEAASRCARSRHGGGRARLVSESRAGSYKPRPGAQGPQANDVAPGARRTAANQRLVRPGARAASPLRSRSIATLSRRSPATSATGGRTAWEFSPARWRTVLSMSVRVALAGDTMLGRGVAERLAADPDHALLAAEVAAIAREADLFILNLEGGISALGAGPDEAAARAPVVLPGGGLRVRVVAATDHPSEYAAAPDRPGIA